MLKNMSMPGRTGSIIVADCATEAEAWASIRWVLPVLNEWPHRGLGHVAVRQPQLR